ncbi:MAG TPA: hypothetical protein VNN08_03900 [Thermoanaerobaculia bacterium]|nr:hypothetical protein [Thermoanaerobaculia bacterium]
MEKPMEGNRNYRIVEDEIDLTEEEREYEAAQREEVPFHIPRD